MKCNITRIDRDSNSEKSIGMKRSHNEQNYNNQSTKDDDNDYHEQKAYTQYRRNLVSRFDIRPDRNGEKHQFGIYWTLKMSIKFKLQKKFFRYILDAAAISCIR